MFELAPSKKTELLLLSNRIRKNRSEEKGTHGCLGLGELKGIVNGHERW